MSSVTVDQLANSETTWEMRRLLKKREEDLLIYLRQNTYKVDDGEICRLAGLYRESWLTMMFSLGHTVLDFADTEPQPQIIEDDA